MTHPLISPAVTGAAKTQTGTATAHMRSKLFIRLSPLRLAERTAAELLLRAGVLTGWLGSCAQTKEVQESAKNLITESAEMFEALSAEKKLLEARTEPASCYWREGRYDEARIILKGVIERLTTDSELKARVALRSAIVERSLTRYK